MQLNGAETIEVASRLWPDVVKARSQHGCFKVLGVAETSRHPGLRPHADLFLKLGIDAAYRIAWVELNTDAHEATAFTDIVLSNRGLPGKLFADVEDAKHWLSSSG